MYVARLSLQDFRSYDHVDVALTPGVTAFVGANGQGKTNLVEAIDYLSRLQSHRVAGEAPLIRAGASRAIVRAEVVKDGRSAELEVELTPGKSNRARINRSVLPRARDLVGLVRTVVFSPEDLALVKGDPGERRRFLDDLAVLRTPRLAGTLADYDRIVRQRSTLLKTAGASRRGYRGRSPRPPGPPGPPELGEDGAGDGRGSGEGALATLDVWDDHLARVGAEIVSVRSGLITDLAPYVAQAYATVARGASRDDAAIGYRPSFDLDAVSATPERPDQEQVREAILAELIRRRRDELDRGVCLVGPHRDDLLTTLGLPGTSAADAGAGGAGRPDADAGTRLPVKGYASHGESWSFALALRLASYELLRDEGDDPILILDDVFAELDASRRSQLAERVAGAEQVLVTAAVEGDVPEALAGTRFAVGGGQVVGRDAAEDQPADAIDD